MSAEAIVIFLIACMGISYAGNLYVYMILARMGMPVNFFYIYLPTHLYKNCKDMPGEFGKRLRFITITSTAMIYGGFVAAIVVANLAEFGLIPM